MMNDRTQTQAMKILALFDVIILRYWTGRVTAKYLSIEMAHRFKTIGNF